MNYIVFDLEWNQGDTGQEEPGIPFEIIEIGAVKLDQEGRVAGKFSQLVKPTVYQRMHQATGRLIHLQNWKTERLLSKRRRGFWSGAGRSLFSSAPGAAWI